MLCVQKPRLLILVRDRAQVPAHDLPIGILTDVVLGHLKHSEVEVGDWAEGAAGDEDDGLLVRVPKDALKAVSG